MSLKNAIPITTIQKVLGHTTRMLMEIYRYVTQALQEEAAGDRRSGGRNDRRGKKISSGKSLTATGGDATPAGHFFSHDKHTN